MRAGLLRNRQERREHRRIVDQRRGIRHGAVGQRGHGRLQVQDLGDRHGDHGCAERPQRSSRAARCPRRSSARQGRRRSCRRPSARRHRRACPGRRCARRVPERWTAALDIDDLRPAAASPGRVMHRHGRGTSRLRPRRTPRPGSRRAGGTSTTPQPCAIHRGDVGVPLRVRQVKSIGTRPMCVTMPLSRRAPDDARVPSPPPRRNLARADGPASKTS